MGAAFCLSQWEDESWASVFARIDALGVDFPQRDETASLSRIAIASIDLLLDTNACIAIISGRTDTVRELVLNAERDGSRIAVSSIIAFELWFGAAKSARVDANIQALKRFLGKTEVLPFDHEDAQIAGSLRHDLRRKGTPIGTYDVLIAAQALRHNALLVTANVREFSRVPNSCWENWEA